MSLITTCPACGTAFHITPKQLSVRRGDVRCGQCQNVFNALDRLTEIHAVTPVQTSPYETAVEGVADATHGESLSPPATPMVVEAAVAQPPGEAEMENVDVSLTPSQEMAGLDTTQLDIVLEPPVEEGGQESKDAPVEAASPVLQEAPVPPPAIEPQPSKQVSQLLTGQPRHGVSSWLLAVCAMLLLLGLLGQTAYFLRTEIAARFPPAKPWLSLGCQWLGCIVELPRQVDLLVIEDSDLQDDPDHEGVLILTYVLYNRAPFAQAYPLLELTLTDTFDQPVLRRTFTPQEYLPKDADIAAGLAPGSEENGRLYLKVEGEQPAGYRLWVKY
ncbi:MAG: zinc-ribbon domain-containing protein [Methylophilaceae bacterium]|nr:zinc-ribbon domain-containing protein [Methylophilaceae bacterium]